MTDALNAPMTHGVSQADRGIPPLILSIEQDQRIDLHADGTAVRGYETYIREYVGMIESGLMARLSNAAYKTLHALALRARVLGDPRRTGAEEEFVELERLGIVSKEDKGHLFCFPSREQLMQDTGMRSVHTVDSALDELAEMKIVKRITPSQPRITRGLFGSNVYIIHPESFIGKFSAGNGDAKQKLLSERPVFGTESSLRHSDNCPLKKKECTTTTALSTRPLVFESTAIPPLIDFFARAIGQLNYAPTEKETRLFAALLSDGFSVEQIESGITRAVAHAREKNRTANLIFCARFVRHPEDQRSRRESNREIDPDHNKSSGEIVTDTGKSSAQIVPGASESENAIFEELGLDETARNEMAQLITLVEEHAGQKLSPALVKRWKTLADEFHEFATQRGVTSLALVRQAVEEALDAGSAKKGFCAPKMARVILTRWMKESAPRTQKKVRTAKREIHPAVRVYQQVHERYPAKGTWDKIAQMIGTDEANLAFWREALSTWATRGYNPLNVAGPLEWFEQRAIPKTKGLAENSNRAADSAKSAPQRPIETLETIQERLRLAARAKGEER
ncbi:hypothetical protein ANRL1_04290 [Anaerolineae bacterium]|nr:hypothetical protein ANRL1_04290 [Anaerolineae bacterium]